MASEAVASFMRFCVDANIDHRQVKDSVRKYLLAYQRNLLHKGAFSALFGDGSFINWEYAERRLPAMDCAHWMAVFRFVDFSTVPRRGSILKRIDETLVSLGLDPALACPLFLITNIRSIPAQAGLSRLLSDHYVPDAYDMAMRYLSKSADAAFDMGETTTIFCKIMLECTVDVDALERQIQFVNVKEQELAESFKVKQIRMVGARPRLRSKLAEISQDVNKSVRNLDNFREWSQTIGFPAAFSMQVRRKLYFLMTQPHIPNPLDHVASITRDTHIHSALKSAHVMVPEVEALHTLIASLILTDEPFKELHDFRCDCMNAFPAKEKNAIDLNGLLHLYVCAYQHPKVWREIWKQLSPLISHQVIRDVEAFVQKRPFNYGQVLAIMNH
jgi:hypothetical protein